MKRFMRSVAGKTTLFVAFTLCLCIIAGCVLGVTAMVVLEVYDTPREEVLYNFRRDRLFARAYNFAAFTLMSSGGTNNTYPEEANTDIIIYDENNKMIASTSGAAAAAEDGSLDKYEYSLGALKRDEEITDIYRHDSPHTDTNAAYYSVVVYTDPDVPLDPQDGLISKAVHMCYSLKYAVYPIGLGALLACLVIFISLMCIAGKHPDTGELCPGPFFKVPYDLILASAVFLGICALFIIDSFGYPGIYFGAIAGGIIGINVFLGLCMSFASRVKQKALIRNSAIYLCLLFLWKLLRWLFKGLGGLFRWLLSVCRDIPMVWRTALITFGICFIEFIVILFCWYETDVLLVFWIIGRLILIPAVLYAAITMSKLQKAGMALAGGDLSYRAETNGLYWDFKRHAENLNSISAGMSQAVEQRLKSERMKTELITNVSHDIKTPLTSIINYASLIGNEKTDNRNISEYSEVLVRQAEKLKRLIEDLVEASKASTGNLDVAPVPCDAAVFIAQAGGEYEEKITAAGLLLVTNVPEKQLGIMADSRRMWRVFDNLMNNICKYSQSGTRVYLSLEASGKDALITFRNTSRDPLNISADELMERFVRADTSRNTEGNGLGLSIARSLTELQGGTFNLSIDGDLFKVELRFPII